MTDLRETFQSKARITYILFYFVGTTCNLVNKFHFTGCINYQPIHVNNKISSLSVSERLGPKYVKNSRETGNEDERQWIREQLATNYYRK